LLFALKGGNKPSSSSLTRRKCEMCGLAYPLAYGKHDEENV
jgi:hypothetical protein